MDAPKPGFWAWEVERGGTFIAVVTGAWVLSLCELASGYLCQNKSQLLTSVPVRILMEVAGLWGVNRPTRCGYGKKKLLQGQNWGALRCVPAAAQCAFSPHIWTLLEPLLHPSPETSPILRRSLLPAPTVRPDIKVHTPRMYCPNRKHLTREIKFVFPACLCPA